MADIKNIRVDGVDYDIKDETARNSIGDLSQLNTDAKDDLVSALNELSANAGSGSCSIQRIESLDESNLKNLRDLEAGSYVLYGYFRPYAGAANILPFDNLLVNVYRADEGSHLFEFSTANSEVNFIEILVDDTADDGYTYTRTPINMLELTATVAKVGNLDELATTEKGTVVAAINEVAASGGSSLVSWNDLTDKPFGEEGTGAVIEWDANYEGMEVVYPFGKNAVGENTDGFVKISDFTPSYEELLNSEIAMVSGGQTVVVPNEELPDLTPLFMSYNGATCIGEIALIVYGTSFIRPSSPEEVLTVPGPGIYVNAEMAETKGVYITKLSYGSTTIKTLDEKFIPDTIARKSDIVSSGNGGAVSWNDLTDKPFGGDETTIEWDGVVTDEMRTNSFPIFGEGTDSYAKISDFTPTYEELLSSEITMFEDDVTITAPNEESPDLKEYFFAGEGAVMFTEYFMVVYGTSFEMPFAPEMAFTAPEPGIYVNTDIAERGSYVTRISYGSTKTIEPKYLPVIPAIPDATGETVSATEFNALLAALREAGYLAS